jgi:hypothetical protein
LGFEKNQFIALTHKDTGHLHLHIVVNRVDFDGKTLSDSNNYKKIAAYCRKMELQYNLKQVLSPRAFLSKEMSVTPRLDSRKEVMKTDIRISLLKSQTFSEFESMMKQRNYEVIKGRGVAFRDQKKMYAKGSEVGYSLSKIENILQLTLTQKQLIISNDLRKENALTKDPNIIRSGMTKSIVQDNKHPLPKALEILLRPEHDYDHTPHQLIQKKRKKKRSLHL